MARSHPPATPTAVGDPGERMGLVLALAAYALWGVLPIFWRQLGALDGLELLAHRVVWACPIFIGWLVVRGNLADLRAVFVSPSLRTRMAASALLLAGNWFVFVYAVLTHRVLEASLGYFINPLVSVALGRIFLGERLRPLQLAAVSFAAVGIAFAAWQAGGLPWISVALAGSFGTYGLLRKTTKVAPIAGSAFETLLLAPLGVAYLGWQHANGTGAFLTVSSRLDGLLVATGVVTALPLLAFVHAAPRLRLTTLGFVQYLAPTLQFAVALLVFGEPLQVERLVTFALVWAGVATFVADGIAARSESRRQG